MSKVRHHVLERAAAEATALGIIRSFRPLLIPWLSNRQLRPQPTLEVWRSAVDETRPTQNQPMAGVNEDPEQATGVPPYA